jgi:type IX secretion system PorP/SprF family membrane protein
MKHFNRLFCLFLGLIIAASADAQDIHFSQYNNSPLTLNPAQTGNFNCTFRGGVNYRNQWASVASPYVTYSAFFDMPLDMVKGFADNDVVAAGIYLFNDRSGEGTLTNFQAVLTGAYHKALGRDANHRLSLGVGLGFMQKQLDQTSLIWGSQWTGDGFDPNASSGETFVDGTTFGNFNLDVGLMYKGTFLENKLQPEAGFTAFHLTQPTENFLTTGGENQLGMRYLGHLRVAGYVTDQISITPSFLYQTQSAASEIIAGADFGYLIETGTFQATASVGAHYRFDDAIIAQLGFDYKNLTFGFSYDITTSSLSDAASGVGGFELALIYKGCVLPVLPKEYVMPCPRY